MSVVSKFIVGPIADAINAYNSRLQQRHDKIKNFFTFSKDFDVKIKDFEILSPATPQDIQDFMAKAAALDAAQQKMNDADQARQAAANQAFQDAAAKAQAAAAAQQALEAAQAAQDEQAIAAAQQALDAAKQALEVIQTDIMGIVNEIMDATKQDTVTNVALIKSDVVGMKIVVHDAYQAWMQKNFPGGVAPDGVSLSPSALKGAKEAINAKYGEWSVSW
jgi:regulator of protease activity HflC (stomatin/prohibitin superfamily)